MFSATAPRPRLLTRLMLVLGLLAVLSPLTLSPAVAAPAGGSTAVVATTTQAAAMEMAPVSVQASTPAPGSTEGILPITRWSGAVSNFHSRVSGGVIPFNSIRNAIARDFMAGNAMSTAGMFWSFSSGMVEGATSTRAFDNIALRLDNAAGVILDAVLFGSGQTIAMAAAIVIILLGFTFWKSIRGGSGRGVWKTFLHKTLLIGVLFIMAQGAANTNVANGTFGTLSPGWILNTIDRSVSQVAAAPATAFMLSADMLGTPEDSIGGVNCQDVRATLYQFHDNATRGRGSASVSRVLNGIWEQSSLQAWTNTQFGADVTSQEMAAFVYCHLLDNLGGVPMNAGQVREWVTPEWDGTGNEQAPTQQTNWSVSGMAARGPLWDGTVLRADGGFAALAPSDQRDFRNSNAMRMGGANELTRSASIFAWVSCQPNGSGGWQWRDFNSATPGLVSPVRSDGSFPGEANDHCGDWWSDPDWDGHDSAWDFGSDPRHLNERIDNDEVRQFVSVTQGATGNMDAIAMGTGNLISAAIVTFVFVMLSGVVILARVAMAAMVLMIVIVMVWSLLPGQSIGHRMGLMFKKFVGFSLLATGASLILSVIALMTAMVTQIGGALFPPGSVGFSIFLGFAPLLSVWIMHMLFTKVMKVASPFTPSGLQQWGKSAASMTAAAAGAGAGGFLGSKMGQRLKSRASHASDKAIGRVDQATGGMLSKMGATKHSSTRTAQRAGFGTDSKHAGADAMKDGAREETKGTNAPKSTETIETAGADAVATGTAFKGGAADTRRSRRGFEMGTHDADGKKLSAAERRGIRDHAGHAAAEADPRKFAKWMADQHQGENFDGWTPDQATDADYEKFGKATLKTNRKERISKTRADMAEIKAQDARTKAETLGPSTRRAVDAASKAAYANALAGGDSKKDARAAARATKAEEYKARGGRRKAVLEDVKHTPGGVAAAARSAKDPQTWKKTSHAVKGGLKVAAGAGLVSTGVLAAPGAYLVAKGTKQAVGGTMAERRKSNDQRMAAYYANKQAQAKGPGSPSGPAQRQTAGNPAPGVQQAGTRQVVMGTPVNPVASGMSEQ